MDEKIISTVNKIRLLAEQNPEFKKEMQRLFNITSASSVSDNNEHNTLNHTFSSNSNENSFNAFLALQHNKIRKIARTYYKDIKDLELRHQLINDHTMMIWYKSIYEVEKYFVYVNYQIENMLNFYLKNTNFHSKVKELPSSYCKIISNQNIKFSMSIDVYSYAFNKNDGKNVSVEKISSLWAKLLYWAIDSDSFKFLCDQIGNFSAIINIRNQTNHSYYARKSNSSTYWKNQEDDMNFAFISGILKYMRGTILNLNK